METEQEGPRASRTSGKAILRIGPRVRVMLVRDRGPIYVRPLSSSGEVYALLKEEMLSSDRGRFLVLLLDRRNKLLGIDEVSTASLGTSIVHPRELFKAAILANAAAIICSHNHPSGDPTPSAEDRCTTERLRRAAEVLGIPILDHVVIGDPSFYSFADNGW